MATDVRRQASVFKSKFEKVFFFLKKVNCIKMDGNQTHVHLIPQPSLVISTEGVALQAASPVPVTKVEHMLPALCSMNTKVLENRSQPMGRCMRET